MLRKVKKQKKNSFISRMQNGIYNIMYITNIEEFSKNTYIHFNILEHF